MYGHLVLVFLIYKDLISFNVGIVLWELFSLGKTPYPGIEPEKLYDLLLKNYRMSKPDFAPREVYKIMFDCWAMEPSHRPRFRELTDIFGDLLGEGERDHYTILSQNFDREVSSSLLDRMASPDYAVRTFYILLCIKKL